VAIYSPASSTYFGGFEAGTGGRPVAGGGGAERQMATLAQELAERDLRVALIVWTIERPTGLSPNLDFVERPPHVGDDSRLGKMREAARVWRACADADASVYVYRGGGPLLWVVSAFCRLRRRKLVFSAASDLDFDFDRPDRSGSQLALYRRALPHVDVIVAQRQEQLELARAAGFGPVVMIRSSSLPAEPTQRKGEAFLWISRLVDYKRPLSYLRLAESVPEARFWAVWNVTDETRPGLAEEVDFAVEQIENLEVLGQLPHEKLLSLIDRAVAVVSTSAAEGMPNVFLEAWARGVPVLSLDYDPDGRIASLGLGIVAGNSEQRFSEAARELWERPELRSEMGRKGRDYVLSEHAPGVVADRWAAMLKGLTGGDSVAAEGVPA
jgi:glycosyltransferase involved in cell wall biosynthesis